jgi:glyoxylase-like metal-dependent hydrolase (beta-lactamase superfamily II)
MNDAKVREVAAGVFVVHLPLPMRPTIVNVTLLRAGDEWVLVDTGVNSSDSIAVMESALRAVGCKPAQVAAILCTHHHPDHFGASRTYQEMCNAQLYVHRKEHEGAAFYGPHRRREEVVEFFIRNGIPMDRFVNLPSPGEIWADLYVPGEPDHFLEDGQHVRIGNLDIEVITTPGHTQGHYVLYLRDRGIMIVGDHLLPKITPHVGLFPGGAVNPLRDFLDSQRKVQKFDAKLVLPAHGGVYTDHRHRARQIIQHHDYRIQEMLDIVRRRPRTAYDIARLAFGFDAETSLAVQFPATFETLAHLELLRAEGRVQREDGAERMLYRASRGADSV